MTIAARDSVEPIGYIDRVRGHRFGSLTSIQVYRFNGWPVSVIFLCDCGERTRFYISQIRQKRLYCCKCHSPPLEVDGVSNPRLIRRLNKPLYLIWKRLKDKGQLSRGWSNYNGFKHFLLQAKQPTVGFRRLERFNEKRPYSEGNHYWDTSWWFRIGGKGHPISRSAASRLTHISECTLHSLYRNGIRDIERVGLHQQFGVAPARDRIKFTPIPGTKEWFAVSPDGYVWEGRGLCYQVGGYYYRLLYWTDVPHLVWLTHEQIMELVRVGHLPSDTLSDVLAAPVTSYNPYGLPRCHLPRDVVLSDPRAFAELYLENAKIVIPEPVPVVGDVGNPALGRLMVPEKYRGCLQRHGIHTLNDIRDGKPLHRLQGVRWFKADFVYERVRKWVWQHSIS